MKPMRQMKVILIQITDVTLFILYKTKVNLIDLANQKASTIVTMVLVSGLILIMITNLLHRLQLIFKLYLVNDTHRYNVTS